MGTTKIVGNKVLKTKVSKKAKKVKKESPEFWNLKIHLQIGRRRNQDRYFNYSHIDA